MDGFDNALINQSLSKPHPIIFFTMICSVAGYVYNPKEARLRKALRDQSRGPRSSTGPAPSSASRWTKYALTMNHHRQSLVSPVVSRYSLYHHLPACNILSSWFYIVERGHFLQLLGICPILFLVDLKVNVSLWSKWYFIYETNLR